MKSNQLLYEKFNASYLGRKYKLFDHPSFSSRWGVVGMPLITFMATHGDSQQQKGRTRSERPRGTFYAYWFRTFNEFNLIL
jgi:hypothetical protein